MGGLLILLELISFFSRRIDLFVVFVVFIVLLPLWRKITDDFNDDLYSQRLKSVAENSVYYKELRKISMADNYIDIPKYYELKHIVYNHADYIKTNEVNNILLFMDINNNTELLNYLKSSYYNEKTLSRNMKKFTGLKDSGSNPETDEIGNSGFLSESKYKVYELQLSNMMKTPEQNYELNYVVITIEYTDKSGRKHRKRKNYSAAELYRYHCNQKNTIKYPRTTIEEDAELVIDKRLKMNNHSTSKPSKSRYDNHSRSFSKWINRYGLIKDDIQIQTIKQLRATIEEEVESVIDEKIKINNHSNSKYSKSRHDNRSRSSYKSTNRYGLTKDDMQNERSKLKSGMRYDVLKQDNFACTICGRTAKKDGVKLHVDHIKPVSKGGKSVRSNLRTLCQDCNLGKSDKYNADGLN